MVGAEMLDEAMEILLGAWSGNPISIAASINSI